MPSLWHCSTSAVRGPSSVSGCTWGALHGASLQRGWASGWATPTAPAAASTPRGNTIFWCVRSRTGQTRSAGTTAEVQPPSTHGENVSHPFPHESSLSASPLAVCWEPADPVGAAGDSRTPQGNLGHHSDLRTAQVLFLASEIAPQQHLKETCPWALPLRQPLPQPQSYQGFPGTETFITQTRTVQKVSPPRTAGTKLLCSKHNDLPPSPTLVTLLCSDHVWYTPSSAGTDRQATTVSIHRVQLLTRSSKCEPS